MCVEIGTAVVNSNIGATYDSGIWDLDDALEGEAYFICI